jgi:predicted RNase H-like HicB family nuclease
MRASCARKSGRDSLPHGAGSVTRLDLMPPPLSVRVRPFMRQDDVSLRRRGVILNGAMELAFTAVFRKVAEGYIAYVEELPGANTQGDTLEEARENFREAVELVLEANRELARADGGEGDVIREPLRMQHG